MFVYKKGDWVKKGQKHAYVIHEWYLKMIDPKVTTQARGQNNRSRALK